MSGRSNTKVNYILQELKGIYESKMKDLCFITDLEKGYMIECQE